MSPARLVVLVTCLVVLAPNTSRAGELSDIDRPVKVLELVIPDLRLELAEGDTRLVLSVPVAFTVASPRLGSHLGATLVAFVEPQLRVTDGTALRGLAGTRTYLFARRDDSDAPAWGPLLELGGVVGQDGSGGFAGAGVAWGDLRLGISIALIGRVVATTDENRADFALEVQLPWNAR